MDRATAVTVNKRLATGTKKGRHRDLAADYEPIVKASSAATLFQESLA